MPNLKLRPLAPTGHVHHVTPENAGWTYVGFDLHRLPNAGDVAHGGVDDREVCIVLISGRAAIEVDGQTFLAGERMSPFEGQPWSVYAPAGARWRIEALTALEVAVCSAPGKKGARPARLIGPKDARAADARQGHQYALPDQYPARDGGCGFAAGGRGDHARAGTRRAIRRTGMTRTTCRGRAFSKRRIITGFQSRRALGSSASIPTTARSTRPC